MAIFLWRVAGIGRSVSRHVCGFARGMLHDPKRIDAVGIAVIQPAKAANGRGSPFVSPFVDFGMAVHKCKSARAAVVSARKVDNRPLLRGAWPAGHSRTPFRHR